MKKEICSCSEEKTTAGKGPKNDIEDKDPKFKANIKVCNLRRC